MKKICFKFFLTKRKVYHDLLKMEQLGIMLLGNNVIFWDYQDDQSKMRKKFEKESFYF